MDIIKFDEISDNLMEKYAPINIKQIIGAERQLKALVIWLKKYEKNAIENLKKQNNKKIGKKVRKRKSVAKDAGKDNIKKETKGKIKSKKNTKKQEFNKNKIKKTQKISTNEDDGDNIANIENDLNENDDDNEEINHEDNFYEEFNTGEEFEDDGDDEDEDIDECDTTLNYGKIIYRAKDNGENEDNKIIENKKIKKKDPNICSCAVLTGDHGTGKTAMVRAVLNGMGYLIKSVNFAKMGTIKAIDDFIENLLTGEDIYDTIENTKHRKFAIIADEIQSVSTPKEKLVINNLLRLNSEKWACPVIFIGSNKHKKIMSLVKKDCYHIAMYAPSNNDMAYLLERICTGEGMQFDAKNTNVIDIIIAHCQSDYRRLIVTLGELYRLYGKNVITLIHLNNYMKFTEEKDMDRSIYENTNRLLSQYDGINPALKVFENDKTIMPLMMHQNHFLATNRYIKNKAKLINLSAEMAENLAHGDVVDNYIYSDQIWSLQETHGFYTCVYPSFKLNNNIDTKKLATDSKNPYYKPTFISQYPKDLNRTSTRCINYKNVKIANEYINDMTIEDYVMAVKLIKNLLKDNRVEECKNILKNYNLTAQGIMYILKIDKINGTRKDVSKAIEKKVKDISTEAIKASIVKYK